MPVPETPPAPDLQAHDGRSVGEVLAAAARFAAQRFVDTDGRVRHEVDLDPAPATPAPALAGDLADQAALTIGLLAATEGAPGSRLAATA